jgi:hypothetical protein
MKHIKDINSFISEAISMKMYKENLPREYWYKKPMAYKKWDKLFGKGINRISIPLKNSSLSIPDSTPLMEEINEIFIPLGYKINSFEDYLNNKVYKIGDTKNPMKIGGLLNKINPTLFKKYDTSTERKEWKDKINNSDKDLKIIISRHPYDLLGMSSGREWRLSSCMRLGAKDDKVYKLLGFDEYEEDGKFKNKIKEDIKQGVLIAYVVKSEDSNINKPISRLLIKPYVNEKDGQDILWVSADRLYGQSIGGFKSSVDEWLGSWQGEDFVGLYCMKRDLYADGMRGEIEMFEPIDKWTDKDRIEFLNEVCFGRHKWTLNYKGEVDVDGNVYFGHFRLTEIPVKFGRVMGDFRCGWNNLTTLKNCPDYVDGLFVCAHNKLTSLQYCPTSVNTFSCYNNQLTSLEFAPTSVSGSFECYNNQLTSLEFSPTSVNTFSCYNNQLTSLEFAPTTVRFDFKCSNNQLTSLEFVPKNVGGSFWGENQTNGYKFTKEEVQSVCQVGGSIYV